MKLVLKSRWFRFGLMLLISSFVLYGTVWYVCLGIRYPFQSKITAEAAVGISILFGGLFLIDSRKRKFAGIEHGSAKWAKPKEARQFRDSVYTNNMILSKEVLFSASGAKFYSLHVNVVGGSGSGKTWCYVTPNVMQENASYVIVDPSGGTLKNTGRMLESDGYDVKVFNVVSFANSKKFNPLAYYRGATEIDEFINVLLLNTGGDKQDEGFWRDSEKLWLEAHIAFVQETCEKQEQNMSSVMMLLNNSRVKEDDDEYVNAVDILFRDLERKTPSSYAVKQYKKFKLAAGKTAKSILVSVGVRLSHFDIPEVANLTSDDELDLDSIGDKKTALFLVLDDLDSPYNYLVAILIDLLFRRLKKVAGSSTDGRPKVPVRILLDEIANIGKFPIVPKAVAVMRKYGVSMEFLWQSVGQMKAAYKDNWEDIDTNCFCTIFLGGKGAETTKHVSEDLLGKATIDTVSYGGSGNRTSIGKDNYNTNEQKSERFLLDQTEVNRIPPERCIVSITGKQPFYGHKYDPKKHPNYGKLANGNPKKEYRFQRGVLPTTGVIHYVTLEINKNEEISI